MAAGVDFSYGGLDVGTTGVGNGVLGRVGGGNAKAAVGTSATPRQVAGGNPGPQANGASVHQGGPGVIAVVVGLIGVAFLLWLVRKNSQHLQGTTLGWNWYNGLSTTLMVGIGFTLVKLAANKIPGPNPVTTVINAW